MPRCTPAQRQVWRRTWHRRGSIPLCPLHQFHPCGNDSILLHSRPRFSWPFGLKVHNWLTGQMFEAGRGPKAPDIGKLAHQPGAGSGCWDGRGRAKPEDVGPHMAVVGSSPSGSVSVSVSLEVLCTAAHLTQIKFSPTVMLLAFHPYTRLGTLMSPTGLFALYSV